MKFWATYEVLKDQRAVIVELTNITTGEWAGTGRVALKNGSRSDLINAAYMRASQDSSSKGGVLDRFSEFAQ